MAKKDTPHMTCTHCGKHIVWDPQQRKWVHVVAANEGHPADPR